MKALWDFVSLRILGRIYSVYRMDFAASVLNFVAGTNM